MEALKELFAAAQLNNLWMIMMLVLVVVGALLCFVGYRFLRIMMALVGFALGGFLSLGILQTQFTMPDWLVITLAVIIGLIIAVLSYVLFRLGVFLMSSVITFFMAGGLMGTFMTEDQFMLMLIIAIAAGVIVGLLALVMTRQLLILVTALGGGWILAEALLAGMVFQPGAMPVWMLWVFWGILAILGLFVQFKYTARGVEHKA